MRFHDYAREHSYPDRKIPIRSGKGWDELRTGVSAKLRDVRLDYLRAAMTANDAVRVREASTQAHERLPEGRGRRAGSRRRPQSERPSG